MAMNSKQIDIKLDSITNKAMNDMINVTLNRAGLSKSELNNQNNARLFADTFTSVVCEILILNNEFGEFKFQHLVIKTGDMNGEQLLVRGKGLAVVSEVNPCNDVIDCNLKPTSSPKYEDKFPIMLLKVSDTINDYCLKRTFCSNDGIQTFINAIRADLATAINVYIEEKVERNFANISRYTTDMTITVKDEATEKDITKAIRKAYHLLQNRNKKNERPALTKTVQTKIWGLLNISSIVDYESILNCCANSEQRLGSFFNRLQVSDFLDENDKPQTNIIGVIYDQETHPIQFGDSNIYSVNCPNEPIIKVDTLYQQAAFGLTTFKSRIIIKTDTEPVEKNINTDKDSVNLTIGGGK